MATKFQTTQKLKIPGHFLDISLIMALFQDFPECGHHVLLLLQFLVTLRLWVPLLLYPKRSIILNNVSINRGPSNVQDSVFEGHILSRRI